MNRRTIFMMLPAILAALPASAKSFRGQVVPTPTERPQPGVMSVDLGQWKTIHIKHGSFEVDIPTETIMQELAR